MSAPLGDDLSDVLVDVIMGYECNVRCDYCSIEEELRPRNMATREILAELTRARAQGMRKVAFGGGEPTIRRDLLPLVRYARDRGFESVKVSSNGLMYSYMDYARQARDAGVTQFNISAMAHEPGLYERIMGRSDAFEMVVRGVANLIELGQVPALDLIVKADTHEHLADIVAFWAARGVRTFPVWLVALTGRNAAFPDSMPRVTEMRPSIIRAFEAGRALGVDVTSRHIPRCMLRGYEDHVRDLREDRVLVVTPGSRFSLWDSEISPGAHSPRCDGCALRGECFGVRRDYLATYGDGELEPYDVAPGLTQ